MRPRTTSHRRRDKVNRDRRGREGLVLAPVALVAIGPRLSIRPDSLPRWRRSRWRSQEAERYAPSESRAQDLLWRSSPAGAVTLQLQPLRGHRKSSHSCACASWHPPSHATLPTSPSRHCRRVSSSTAGGRVVRSAIANAALQVSVLVADQAAAFSRTAKFAVGVHTAVASSAVDVSEIVTDAVAGEDGGNHTKGQSTGYNEARNHGISNGFKSSLHSSGYAVPSPEETVGIRSDLGRRKAFGAAHAF